MIDYVRKKLVISPSILAADFRKLGREIEEAQAAGADWIHVDIMDGQFVPNLSMGPRIVEACRKSTDLPLDVHLMIEKPEKYVQAFADAGADSISVHRELNPHLHRSLEVIQSLGLRSGVVINPGTSPESLSEVLERTDLILVMTVNPGFGGQKYIPETSEKIEKVRDMIESSGRDIQLQVDGGISKDTAPLAAAAGANNFVAGYSIFRHPEGISKGIEEIRASLQEYWG